MLVKGVSGINVYKYPGKYKNIFGRLNYVDERTETIEVLISNIKIIIDMLFIRLRLRFYVSLNK